jgi:hypothetical protein
MSISERLSRPEFSMAAAQIIAPYRLLRSGRIDTTCRAYAAAQCGKSGRQEGSRSGLADRLAEATVNHSTGQSTDSILMKIAG